MALQFKKPSEVSLEYRQRLKALKPEVNVDQTDSDWYIRSLVLGGVISGVYADQSKIADDPFPQSARREAVQKHLFTYFNRDFLAPTQADGFAAVTGTPGSTVPALTEFVYTPNGNVYQASAPIVLVGASGLVPVTSVSSGQEQNLLSNAALTISSPPVGIQPASLSFGNIANGKNQESLEEAVQAILTRIRQPPAGGTENDYKTFTREASSSVVDINVLRYIYGLGTLGIVFTAGTTDIDAALNGGVPVVRMPSAALINEVQAYVEAKKVLTDCVYVFGPTEALQNVTVRVRYSSGDHLTIPTGQTLTQQQLVIREVQRAIYKTPPGGRRFGASGFLVLSEIEEVIDLGLSALPYTEGNYTQILLDRQADDLSATGPNRLMLSTEIIVPGTITVVQL